MSVDRWLPAVVAGVGVVVSGGVAIYVSGPWRRRIVDEIAMREHAPNARTRRMLDELIDRDVARYAFRRREGYGLRRVLLLLSVVVTLANFFVFVAVPDNPFTVWIGTVMGAVYGYLGLDVFEKWRRFRKIDAVTTPRSSGRRPSPKRRRP